MAQGKHLGQRDEDGNLIKATAEIVMPPIPPAFRYLLSLFSLSGQCMQSGMGLLPLNWQEIKAFIEVNSLDLMLWEIELIKHMSEAYCSEFHRATDPLRPAPFSPEKQEDEIDHIGMAMQFREQMRLLRKQDSN